MQCACVILLYVTSPALQHFHIISYTHDFRNSVIEYKMHVLIFSTIIFGKVSHCKKQYHVVQNWKCSGDKILIKGILDILKYSSVHNKC